MRSKYVLFGLFVNLLLALGLVVAGYLYTELRAEVHALEERRDSDARLLRRQDERLQAVEQLARPDVDRRLTAVEARLDEWAPKLTESFKYLYEAVNVRPRTVFVPSPEPLRPLPISDPASPSRPSVADAIALEEAQRCQRAIRDYVEGRPSALPPSTVGC